MAHGYGIHILKMGMHPWPLLTSLGFMNWNIWRSVSIGTTDICYMLGRQFHPNNPMVLSVNPKGKCLLIQLVGIFKKIYIGNVC